MYRKFVFNAVFKKLEALPFEWLFEGVLCHITKNPSFQWCFSTQNPSTERLGGGRTPNDASCVRRGSCAKAPRQALVGGAITILKNMKVNGKDDIPYMKWKKNVPNHQPVHNCTHIKI